MLGAVNQMIQRYTGLQQLQLNAQQMRWSRPIGG